VSSWLEGEVAHCCGRAVRKERPGRYGAFTRGLDTSKRVGRQWRGNVGACPRDDGATGPGPIEVRGAPGSWQDARHGRVAGKRAWACAASPQTYHTVEGKRAQDHPLDARRKSTAHTMAAFHR